MDCSKCDSRIIYVGKIQSTGIINLNDQVLFDDSLQDQSFFWVCSGCGRKYKNTRDSFELADLNY